MKKFSYCGEKFCAFPYKTYRMEYNCVLSEWQRRKEEEDGEKTIERPASEEEENVLPKLIWYFIFIRKLWKFLLSHYWEIIGCSTITSDGSLSQTETKTARLALIITQHFYPQG